MCASVHIYCICMRVLWGWGWWLGCMYKRADLKRSVVCVSGCVCAVILTPE